MKPFKLLFFFSILYSTVYSQNYTSYFTGNTTDIQTTPSGGVCLMGGATENDNAMIWFLQQANGGDVLVLRASGTNGYNNYLYSQLGVTVNSVETIVFHASSAATEAYIHQKIQQAEAIWIAGGDQWDYISYWRDTPIADLINDAISTKNIVIGGTSAGMAILGEYYFSAENGTVTSLTALADPFNSNVTVDGTPFLTNDYLQNVITDTHYDNPDRKGRHLVFLARILVDDGIAAKGIACDEYTAVCIDGNGMAKVYGDFPTYDDNAYFIQTNCELSSIIPEDCSSGTPLDWNLNNVALKVYAVKGTTNGSNTFDLNDWQTGTGGVWENWYVENGVLHEQTGTQPNCDLSVSDLEPINSFTLYPNPSSDEITIVFNTLENIPESLKIINLQGQIIKEQQLTTAIETKISISDLPSGVYFMEISFGNKNSIVKKLIVK